MSDHYTVLVELADLWDVQAQDAEPSARRETFRECADGLRMIVDFKRSQAENDPEREHCSQIATAHAIVAPVREQMLQEIINSPETRDFIAAVPIEAAHQRDRWGSEHDGGKQAEDWFWLIGYLAGKALAAAKIGDTEKALHHTISTAAALANWHASLAGYSAAMRPGIAPPDGRQ